uniref:Uncharacterized protein n=1 Tax=Knipowitschia caucasica TaxID=637954 RepID=A0AAV2KBY4_KNICA
MSVTVRHKSRERSGGKRKRRIGHIPERVSNLQQSQSLRRKKEPSCHPPSLTLSHPPSPLPHPSLTPPSPLPHPSLSVHTASSGLQASITISPHLHKSQHS